jgi:CheY-like chemotaxis protein
MSHEIRTPMTAVLGYADLLATPNLSQQDRREFLGLIQRNGKSLLAIINDILDLSKIESGRVELEMAETSPRQTVEEVVRLMHARAEEKGLRLSVDSPGDVPHKVRTDPTRLRQVLTNLVGNAVKYTDRGEVRVGLSSRPRSDGKTVLQLSVADTGIGIEAEKLQEVFDPFTQADTSHTRQYGGTGLGLAISQRLASMLGGEIQVQSTPGEGSVFTLTIAVDAVADTPRPKAPGTEQAEQTSAPEAAARRLEGRVLLVEDSPDLQGLMQVVLQGLGLHVDVASDGREACDMATQSKRDAATYDLILMDIQMPVMNGYEATRELRKRGWMGGIVALTAHALGRDRDACLAAGCDDYLPKPFTSEQLLNRLTRFLATARDD